MTPYEAEFLAVLLWVFPPCSVKIRESVRHEVWDHLRTFRLAENGGKR